MKPYKDLIAGDFIIREFDEFIDPIELMWHRDEKDRIIEEIYPTDWKFQLENELPINIKNPIFIPKLVWHRVIKGSSKLVLRIKEY